MMNFVPVAQWIERLASNQEVAGSTPAGDASNGNLNFWSENLYPVHSLLLCGASGSTKTILRGKLIKLHSLTNLQTANCKAFYTSG